MTIASKISATLNQGASIGCAGAPCFRGQDASLPLHIPAVAGAPARRGSRGRSLLSATAIGELLRQAPSVDSRIAGDLRRNLQAIVLRYETR
jgi:hypothetical protein